MPTTTDLFQLLSDLLAYCGHEVAAQQFASIAELVPFIEAGWLVPAGVPRIVMCQACHATHYVDVVDLDGVLSGICSRTGDTFPVPQSALLHRVDGNAVAQSLAGALHLDGAVRRLQGFETLWTLGGRRLDDTRVVFFFTPNLDRLDLATSVLRAVSDQSRAMTSGLIVATDRIDHVQLLQERQRVITLRNIARLEGNGHLAVDEAQLLERLFPDAPRTRPSGRPSGQRHLILPILDELDVEKVPIDISNETCGIIADRFRQMHPTLKAPVVNTIRSAIRAWLESHGRG